MSVVLSILGVVGGVLLFLLKCIGILLLVVLVLAVLLSARHRLDRSGEEGAL